MQLTRLLLCQLGGLTPEMSEAGQADGAGSEVEKEDSVPEVLGLGFAALKGGETGNTHTCSFVSSVCTCG